MDATKILIGLVIAVLAMNVIIVGIYMNEKGMLKLPKSADKNESAAANQTNVTAEVSIKVYQKCSELNGTECSSSATCSEWLDASDSFSCCSSNCSSSNKTAVTTDLFESSSEDENLGEII